ncbi:MAG: site-specific integrase [Methyloceanibacter sp.]
MLQDLVVPATILPATLSLEQAAGAAGDFARASKADSTLRSYRTDAADFTAWCHGHQLDPLPASVDTLAAYLGHLANSGMKASSITRRCAGLRYMHRAAGYEPPTNSEAIKAVLAGIRRSLGIAPTRKAPATVEAIEAMLAVTPADSLRGLRDRALLLLGFAGALRRSELVALDVDDIESDVDGVRVIIRRSKTDQEGAGDFVPIPNGTRLKPVAAILTWIEAAKISEGPLFRPITKGGTLRPRRLTDCSVAEIVKAKAEAAGFDARVFSGHSLRAGFVTSALAAGADILRVMDQTRHREVRTLKAYDRRAKAFKGHAGEAFL